MAKGKNNNTGLGATGKKKGLAGKVHKAKKMAKAAAGKTTKEKATAAAAPEATTAASPAKRKSTGVKGAAKKVARKVSGGSSKKSKAAAQAAASPTPATELTQAQKLARVQTGADKAGWASNVDFDNMVSKSAGGDFGFLVRTTDGQTRYMVKHPTQGAGFEGAAMSASDIARVADGLANECIGSFAYDFFSNGYYETNEVSLLANMPHVVRVESAETDQDKHFTSGLGLVVTMLDGFQPFLLDNEIHSLEEGDNGIFSSENGKFYQRINVRVIDNKGFRDNVVGFLEQKRDEGIEGAEVFLKIVNREITDFQEVHDIISANKPLASELNQLVKSDDFHGDIVTEIPVEKARRPYLPYINRSTGQIEVRVRDGSGPEPIDGYIQMCVAGKIFGDFDVVGPGNNAGYIRDADGKLQLIKIDTGYAFHGRVKDEISKGYHQGASIYDAEDSLEYSRTPTELANKDLVRAAQCEDDNFAMDMTYDEIRQHPAVYHQYAMAFAQFAVTTDEQFRDMLEESHGAIPASFGDVDGMLQERFEFLTARREEVKQHYAQEIQYAKSFVRLKEQSPDISDAEVIEKLSGNIPNEAEDRFVREEPIGRNRTVELDDFMSEKEIAITRGGVVENPASRDAITASSASKAATKPGFFAKIGKAIKTAAKAAAQPIKNLFRKKSFVDDEQKRRGKQKKAPFEGHVPTPSGMLNVIYDGDLQKILDTQYKGSDLFKSADEMAALTDEERADLLKQQDHVITGLQEEHEIFKQGRDTYNKDTGIITRPYYQSGHYGQEAYRIEYKIAPDGNFAVSYTGKKVENAVIANKGKDGHGAKLMACHQGGQTEKGDDNNSLRRPDVFYKENKALHDMQNRRTDGVQIRGF